VIAHVLILHVGVMFHRGCASGVPKGLPPPHLFFHLYFIQQRKQIARGFHRGEVPVSQTLFKGNDSRCMEDLDFILLFILFLFLLLFFHFLDGNSMHHGHLSRVET
jgi:hypothetical protein